MEDLWKMREMGYRLSDVADLAEYNHMVKRFRDEEERDHRKNLLYGQALFGRAPRDSAE